MMETLRDVETVSLLELDTDPDIGTGTVAVASGARDTLVDPTKVVVPEVTMTFIVAATGSRLTLVTDM
jgi:hypothetical protein